jgi:hypothetical protein
MLNRDREVYSKAVLRKLDALESKKLALEIRVRDLDRRMEELLVGQSPIHVGDCIVWVSSTRERYGRVTSIRTGYNGYEYRVTVLTKAGREIGMATVSEHHQPELR